MKEKLQSGLTGVIREGAGMSGLEEDGLKELLEECSGKGEDEDGRNEIELAGWWSRSGSMSKVWKRLVTGQSSEVMGYMLPSTFF